MTLGLTTNARFARTAGLLIGALLAAGCDGDADVHDTADVRTNTIDTP